MASTRNSFQQWAHDYARAFGYIVADYGNWVTLYREGMAEPAEMMTAQGVQRLCTGITLAHDPNRPWFPS